MSFGIEKNHIKEHSFILMKLTNYKTTLEEQLKSFNVDDYWIVKSSNCFKFVDDLEDMKYAGYIFLHKDNYTKEYIESWLEILYSEIDLKLKYLSKPFPPEYVKKLIKVIDEK